MYSPLDYCPSDITEHFAVYAADSTSLASARLFAASLKVNFFDSGSALDPYLLSFPFVFVYEHGRAEIIQTGKSAPGPVTASFQQGKTAHRLKFGGGKGQMIAKAVGLNKGVLPSVLDATAGLAQDAFVLASLGCQMTLIERSPIIAELIRVALEESKDCELQEITDRMNLIQANACIWLREQNDKVADVIYLDPMYPHRDKSALVKKEMRLFHTLVGESANDADLLEAALEKARYRVVVKRPRKGETIPGRPPAHQIMGKSCRYDIYPLQRLENLK